MDWTTVGVVALGASFVVWALAFGLALVVGVVLRRRRSRLAVPMLVLGGAGSGIFALPAAGMACLAGQALLFERAGEATLAVVFMGVLFGVPVLLLAAASALGALLSEGRGSSVAAPAEGIR